jgi:superfamily II DNA or RNA helicase
MDPPEVIKNIAKIRDHLVTIPVGRVDFMPDHYEIVDKRVEIPVDFPEFGFTLREDQQEVYDQIDGNAIINAKPAWGKTFTGLAIARKLGQKTLVVVHNVPLRNQWSREVEKVFGFKPGVVGSGSFDISTPVVVSNIQTLYRNIDAIKKEFGTLILDEMHHVSAKTFSSVIDTNYAKNKIGLSATIKRKDGKHIMFNDYFGHDVIVARKTNSMSPHIHIVKSDIRFPDGSKTPWALRVNQLTQNSDYQTFISTIAASYAAFGHKVLVVADRVQFLKNCAEMIGDKAFVIVGETENREEELKKITSNDYNVLFGTQSIFAEGINQTNLSCLIMATPINNEPLLEQLIGRIERVHQGKRQPIVVDVHLVGNTARRQASNRMGFYIKQGYKIKQVA